MYFKIMQTNSDILILEKVKSFSKSFFKDDPTGHDWWHVQRVWKTACSISDKEGADRVTVEIAALLHDVSDWKLTNGNEKDGIIKIHQLLRDDLPKKNIENICGIISKVSFKGAKVPTPMVSLEGKVVQDADRLDAMGAVGIARAFAYGGNKGRSIWDPNVPPVLHENFEDYKKNKGPSINHFYEKLLLLKDRMNTETGKKMAEKRHQFMKSYLDHFFLECKGS